ncbi:hypothetical protein [Paenibacillus periandrae]|uniref:hypothetical protein n=1 Tax=Paenibacillus periandrae TaxID=1761741 RepID=UPI001F092354|nr:hypothetical protein [Paenibacillus periandrae]
MLKVGDRVYLEYDILRGLGTVLVLSKTGKTAKVQWPNPYNSIKLAKPTYYKIKCLLDVNFRALRNTTK